MLKNLQTSFRKISYYYFVVPQGELSPISRLRHNQLLNDLPKEVLGSCKNSDQMIRFLDRLDVSHLQRIYKECRNLEQVVASNKGLLLQTGGYAHLFSKFKSNLNCIYTIFLCFSQCFVQKRIFDAERLERLTITVKLDSIGHTTTQHIFTDPLLEFKANCGDELGVGIDCIERILTDPFRYLVRDDRPDIGSATIAENLY